MQPEIPTRTLVTIVYSRADRIGLYCEWAAMPVGTGMIVGSVFGASMGAATGFGPLIWDAVMITVGGILLAYAAWRPMHRRYSMRRSDFWMAPEDQ